MPKPSSLIVLALAGLAIGGALTFRPATADPGMPLSIAPVFTIAETVVLPGERVAIVHARLSEPARRPLAWRYATLNDTAIAGQDYRPTSGQLLFQPGETEQLVRVPLARDLGPRRFFLAAVTPDTYPPIAGASGVVRQGAARAPQPPARPPAYPPVRGARGRRLVFRSDFMAAIGMQPAKGGWVSPPLAQRRQAATGELAPYTNPKVDTGVNPFPVVAGHRVLRAEHVRTRDQGVDYDYSAPWLSSRGWFDFTYGYVELRAKLDRAQGTVPAFWLMPATGGWPPEIDVFEFGLGDDYRLESSLHWRTPGAQPQGETVVLPFTPDDGQFHTYGFEWTRDWQVTLIDGREVTRRPNIFNEPMFLILSMAVGGIAPAPRSPGPGWHSDMTLDTITVWQ